MYMCMCICNTHTYMGGRDMMIARLRTCYSIYSMCYTCVYMYMYMCICICICVYHKIHSHAWRKCCELSRLRTCCWVCYTCVYVHVHHKTRTPACHKCVYVYVYKHSIKHAHMRGENAVSYQDSAPALMYVIHV